MLFQFVKNKGAAIAATGRSDLPEIFTSHPFQVSAGRTQLRAMEDWLMFNQLFENVSQFGRSNQGRLHIDAHARILANQYRKGNVLLCRARESAALVLTLSFKPLLHIGADLLNVPFLHALNHHLRVVFEVCIAWIAAMKGGLRIVLHGKLSLPRNAYVI